MKTLITLAILVCFGFGTFAQSQSPLPKISQQLTDFSSYYPVQHVFVTTDKQTYKPGETIWLSALVTDANTRLPATNTPDLIVKLYNQIGETVVVTMLKVNHGTSSGSIELPDNFQVGQYFLTAYTSNHSIPEDAFITALSIDHAYSNQLIANTTAKDSISVSGHQNELMILLRSLSGEIQKNTNLRYQLMNGKEILEKGKLKTNDSGKTVLQFTLPEKSNGEPFTCELTDNKGDWKKEVFLPSNLDPVEVHFYPEGGTILSGVPVKIGFTAFNKWGIPVEIEGSVINQEGKHVAIVKTVTAGLGLFAVENDGNQKLKLVLSGTTGQNQAFELPASNPNGLAFSVLKTDAEFISANLLFADKQKHSIAITATCGNTLYWAADMDITAAQRVKIPTENLPHGVTLLTVFGSDGKPMAERLVFVDKKHRLNIYIQPEKSSLKQGENMKIKVKVTDENSQPVSASVSVSIADNYRKNESALPINEHLLTDALLETPFCLISESFNGQFTNSAMMDLFLIANRQKGFDWQKIIDFKSGDISANNTENALNKYFDTRILELIKGKAQKLNLQKEEGIPGAQYFSNNEDLFQRAPKVVATNTSARDSQRRLLSNSTNLLDVIKSIKPYQIMNNQIVFYGSENSINAQGGALFVLDGQQLGTDISAIQSISISEVDYINVSTNPMDIQRYTGLNSVGVIEIFQKKGMPAENQSTGKFNMGNQENKTFEAEPNNLKRNNRTTLQWIPELTIDETGEAEITVTAGKVLSDFIVEIQGMSTNGSTGSGKGSFSVVK